MNIKRFLAVLLTVVLSVALVPAQAFAQSTEREELAYEVRHPQAIEVWTQIEQAERSEIAKKSGSFTKAAQAAYAIVEASETTLEGSLEWHGEAFFWRTVDGAACGYNPAFRERVTSTEPTLELEAEEPVVTVKGGVAKSKDVAVFQPYYGIDRNFKKQYANEGESIAKALGGKCTVYKTTNATIDNIAKAIETCGVVIFDSHGDTDYASGEDYVSRANSSYICLQSGTGITEEDQEYVQGKYGRYQHAWYGGSYGSMRYYLVDGTAIANHMSGNAQKGLLWMAICLGMATDGLYAPLRKKGVQTVYGYSQSVTFDGDYKYEESFFYGMKQGATVASAIAMMKREGGFWDPAYHNFTIDVAKRNYAAFPIVVSDEDAYPGKGNVDALQQVYGKGTLMKTSFLYGDLNDDGKVSVKDVSLLLRYTVGLEKLTRDQLLRADVDADSTVGAADAAAILQRIVKLTSGFTVDP